MKHRYGGRRRGGTSQPLRTAGTESLPCLFCLPSREGGTPRNGCASDGLDNLVGNRSDRLALRSGGPATTKPAHCRERVKDLRRHKLILGGPLEEPLDPAHVLVDCAPGEAIVDQPLATSLQGQRSERPRRLLTIELAYRRETRSFRSVVRRADTVCRTCSNSSGGMMASWQPGRVRSASAKQPV